MAKGSYVRTRKIRKKYSKSRLSGLHNGTIVTPNKGKKFTDKHKHNMRLSHLGKHHTESTKKKMRKPRSEEAKQNMRGKHGNI